MMKAFKIFLGAGILLSLLTLSSCNDKVEEVHDDAYYAALASVSSDSSDFTATDDGGSISFGAEGGEVIVNVDCQVEWLTENHVSDICDVYADVEAGTLTFSAVQNVVEEDKTGTVTLMTSSTLTKFATITVSQHSYEPPVFIVDSEWNAPACGELSVVLPVEIAADWTAESNRTWLTAESTADGLKLTVEENTSEESRSGRVTLDGSDGIRTATATVTVVQDGVAYLHVNGDSFTFYAKGQSGKLTMTSNFEPEITYDGSHDWFTLEYVDSTLTVAATADYSGTGTQVCNVTVAAGDGAQNTVTAVISVTEYAKSEDYMIFEYTTEEDDTEVQMLIGGDIDCVVVWGDGTSDNVTEPYPLHTYETAGVYYPAVIGTVTRLNNKSKINNVDSLTGVEQWGNTGLTRMTYAFNYCKQLTHLPETTGDVFKNITSFYGGFQASGLTSVPADLFSNCPVLDSLTYAFSTCSSITELPAGLLDNCTTVIDCQNFINAATKLTKIPDGLFANCTNCTNFSYALAVCSALESIPADLLPASDLKVNINNIFSSCSSLTTIPEGLFDNLPEITACRYVFNGCSSLTSVPASLFDKNKKVTDFYSTFNNCKSLECESPYTVIDGVKVHLYERTNYSGTDYFNGISSITSTSCFKNCTGLTDYADIPSKWGGN